MGLAKYFSKDLLAINQLINSDNDKLIDILLNSKVGLAFDSNAVETFEGNNALDLGIRLLSRLYPKLSIIDLSEKNQKKVKYLTNLARNINTQIEIFTDKKELTLLIVFGQTNKTNQFKGLTLYVGSNNWNATFSQNKVQIFEKSKNPIGSGIATCIAVSNVFRYIFQDYLPNKALDNEIIYSCLNFSTSNVLDNPVLKSTHLKDVVLVGIGAIGNGTIWALSKMESLSGQLSLIDNEEVALSNIQRYVMIEEKHIGKQKAELASNVLSNSKVELKVYKTTWAGFLDKRSNWDIETVAVAIDNIKDRIAIQSALPRNVFNSYTEENLLGIARHTQFNELSCMACGYIPSRKEKNYINEVADNCNIPHLAHTVKDYINLNMNVDQVKVPQNTASLLDVIAQANNFDRSNLNQFHGKKVQEFYSEFVCGGISLSLTNNKNKANLDAPLAFQSAMAGILLAAELINKSGNYRKVDIKQQSHIYPLNAIGDNNPFNCNLSRDESGRCLCSDDDFIKQYNDKWE